MSSGCLCLGGEWAPMALWRGCAQVAEGAAVLEGHIDGVLLRGLGACSLS